MVDYTAITIIYNPRSTGNGKQLADEFAGRLKTSGSNKTVFVKPTAARGHAEKIAYAACQETKRPLIVIAGGDGSYHEVVNGVMRAREDGFAVAVTGLLPGGNANDHHGALHRGDFTRRVLERDEQRIDLLKVEVDGIRPSRRFAHSYAGVGLTSHAGHKLTGSSLNMVNEWLIAIRSFMKFRPISLAINGERGRYDHLLLSNIGKMAKFVTLSGDADASDGLFEITITPHRTKLPLLFSLGRSAAGISSAEAKTDRYTFTCLDKTGLQLDGEIYTAAKGSPIDVSIERQALRCIV